MHPSQNPQQQRDELLRKEEARREESEKKAIEVQLEAFDAYDFYEKLELWASQPIPKPKIHCVHISPIRKERIIEHPRPTKGSELATLRKISSSCARLLYLLRSLDQKGMECPYIHQQNQASLQRAIDRCDGLQKVCSNYLKGSGLWNWITFLFRKSYISRVQRDLEFFKKRLEAVQILCRHHEFALDLRKMNAAVIYRSIDPTCDMPVKTNLQAIPSAIDPPVPVQSRTSQGGTDRGQSRDQRQNHSLIS